MLVFKPKNLMMIEEALILSLISLNGQLNLRISGSILSKLFLCNLFWVRFVFWFWAYFLVRHEKGHWDLSRPSYYYYQIYLPSEIILICFHLIHILFNWMELYFFLFHIIFLKDIYFYHIDNAYRKVKILLFH